MRRNLFIPLLFIFLVAGLICEKLWAGTVEVSSEGLQRLVIKGLDANVTVTSLPQAKTVRVSGVEDVLTPGLYIVEKKGSTLEVHINEWATKSDWKEQLGIQRTRASIDISGFGLATEVYLRDGQVQLSKMLKGARVVLGRGKVNTVDSSGPLEIFVHQGDTSVQNQAGRIKIDQYQGNINLLNLQADLDLVAFNSNINIEKSRGIMSLNTQNSPTKIVQSRGTLQLDNGKGTILIQQFQGRVDGSTQEGALSISLLADSEIHLRSQSGKVQIQLPPASGAALNLSANVGEILIPEGLKINRGVSEKSFRGKLSGHIQKAAVTVRSQEGVIVIK